MHNLPVTKALIILGKFPHPGKVKTRLSKDLGEELAAKFYKSLLENLILESKQLKNIEIFFCYSDVNDQGLIKSWLTEINLIDPVSNDIEKNLSNAFEKLFKNSFTKVISIASDVPSINKKIIQNAFENLSNNDIVIGADVSGGIYLFGTKKHRAEFFQNKLEKGENIFDHTVKNIQTNKLKFTILEKLLDIDTIDDFNKWKLENPDID